jgi:hypothetical protein
MLRPTPPKVPNNQDITLRDWLPIVFIIVIILICACGG